MQTKFRSLYILYGGVAKSSKKPPLDAIYSSKKKGRPLKSKKLGSSQQDNKTLRTLQPKDG